VCLRVLLSIMTEPLSLRGEKGGKKITKPGANKTMPGLIFLSRLKMRMGCAHNSLTDVNRMGTFVITRRLI